MLPTIIFLENHNDFYPKVFIKQLLPKLTVMGYKNFHVESDPSFSNTEIISSYKNHLTSCNYFLDLAFSALLEGVHTRHFNFSREKLKSMPFSKLSRLLMNYVSSQKYSEMAVGINGIIAYEHMLEVFSLLSQYKISLSGIDVNDFQEKTVMTEINLKHHYQNIKRIMSIRDLALFDNLRSISKKGGVVLLGVAHFKGVYELITKHGLQDKFIFCWPKGRREIVKLCYEDLSSNLSEGLFTKLNSAILDEKSDLTVNLATIIRKINQRKKMLDDKLKVSNLKLLFHFRKNQSLNIICPDVAMDLVKMKKSIAEISTTIEKVDSVISDLKNGFVLS